jgi:hypothetical protein
MTCNAIYWQKAITKSKTSVAQTVSQPPVYAIQLAFLLYKTCRKFLCSFTLYNTSFLTWSAQLISILLQHLVRNFSVTPDLLSELSKSQHPNKPCSKRNISPGSLNLRPICWWQESSFWMLLCQNSPVSNLYLHLASFVLQIGLLFWDVQLFQIPVYTRLLKGHHLLQSCTKQLQALTGLQGSRRLRLPDFKTIGTWSWQGCHPYAPVAFTPRKYSWYSFLSEAESTPEP